MSNSADIGKTNLAGDDVSGSLASVSGIYRRKNMLLKPTAQKNIG